MAAVVAAIAAGTAVRGCYNLQLKHCSAWPGKPLSLTSPGACHTPAMRLRVLHETHYDYEPAVQASRHLAHLHPRTTPTQTVLAHALTIDPLPSALEEDTDAWGNGCTRFSLEAAHHSLSVIARSRVETFEPPTPGLTMAWEVAREHLHQSEPHPHTTSVAALVMASPYVPRQQAFADYAAERFEPGRDLAEAARHLAHRIHRDFEYCTLSTDVSTPALHALGLRRGVCQDFAHVMLACLRSLGLAARYVSGYLLTHPAPGQPRLVGGDASHAWVSVYLPDAAGDVGARALNTASGHWWDLDPTNDRPAGADYVTLAIGRDYGDVSPLGGVIQGGGHRHLRVAVTVEPDDLP